MNRVRRAAAVTFGASLLMLVACSGNNNKVTGAVVYKGAPLSGAMVSFHTADGNMVGSGVTNASGEFTLQNAQGKDGIPSGTYKVVVLKTEGTEGKESPTIEAGQDPKDIGKMMAGGAFPKGGRPGGMPMKVTPKPKKSVVPEKFTSPQTTTLEATVPSKEPIRLDLGS